MLDHVGEDISIALERGAIAAPRRVRPDLGVVIPTRNEAGNIGPLLDRMAAARGGRTVEVLFVDDSDDDTPDRIREHADPAGDGLRITVLHREPGERTGGLGGAVLAGLRRSSAEWVVVMDGDMQHPPELALRLPEVGRSRDLDLVVASRHVGAGNADGLGSAGRHLASGAAAVIAKAVFPGRLSRWSDPMSGLFALRVAAVDLDRLRPTGFKILMEVVARYPRLRSAEVPFAMAPRHTGESKASPAEVGRFVRHLLRLRFAVFTGQVRRSATSSPQRFLARALLFGMVGLSGLVVNTGALVLALDLLHLHYLPGAVVATLASTTWLLLLTEKIVFRGSKPGTARSRAVRFVLLNAVTLLARLPLLALLVEWAGVGVVPANLATLALMFVVRFLVADASIYRTGDEHLPPPSDPMRVVVDLAAPAVPSAPAGPSRRARGGRHYLPFRYRIPGIATIGSQVELRELGYFGAQYLGQETDIEVRVGAVGGALPRRRATMTQLAQPPGIGYTEHFGRFGANFHVRLGDRIVVTVAPALARSPHVVYTNVLEALLRFVAVSKGAMLLHSACLELDGVGILISAETDTGKTGTVLRMVRELGARFLSDDMTVLHPDGRVGCFPKPLTISHHTLHAIGNDELSRGEWARLRLQSRLHSKEGREFALLLSRLNIPIMGVNALTQRLVPPPKYTVDRLLPCTIVAETTVSELFVISRGPYGAGSLSRDAAGRVLLANTEDAYQFPPFRQLAPSVLIGGDDHAELRRKERAILATALSRLRCRWISTPDFSWADEIPRVLAGDRRGTARPT